MFGNFINFYDFYRLFDKLKRGQLQPFTKKIFLTRKKRVKESWDHQDETKSHIWDIPHYHTWINERITGDGTVDHRSYIKKKYFPSVSNLQALSLGCGAGQNEVEWADLRIFERIDAFDISDARIIDARNLAEKRGVKQILKFQVGDVSELDLGKERYDFIIFEGSLHHLAPVKDILQKARWALRRDGLLLIKDYVGPARFQWSTRQVRLTNALLKILPDQLKRKQSGGIKRRIFRPSRLSMIISDPSEAVESDKVLPAAEELLVPVEFIKLGGTLVLNLFSEIAHNFIPEDAEATEWLRLLFQIENLLIKEGQIPSDLVMGLYKTRGG